jgi:SAM-dependent methyltransferase
VLAQAAHRLLACARCGLVRLSPLLDPQAMASIVEQEDYHYGGEIDWGRTYSWDELLQTTALRNALADHAQLKSLLERLLPARANPLRVHDIGCSEGFSLALGKREGWVCSGNDLSPIRREFGRRNLGVNFPLATFSQTRNEPLDVVVMRHVLEHLPDPLAELTLVRERLVEGGLLVIVAPNYAAPSLRLKTWRQQVGLRRGSLAFLGVPEHQWQFTARTLGRLLAKCGFAVVSAETTSRQQNHSAPVRAVLRETVHRLRLGSYFLLAARKL